MNKTRTTRVSVCCVCVCARVSLFTVSTLSKISAEMNAIMIWMIESLRNKMIDWVRCVASVAKIRSEKSEETKWNAHKVNQYATHCQPTQFILHLVFIIRRNSIFILLSMRDQKNIEYTALFNDWHRRFVFTRPHAHSLAHRHTHTHACVCSLTPAHHTSTVVSCTDDNNTWEMIYMSATHQSAVLQCFTFAFSFCPLEFRLFLIQFVECPANV